MSVCTRPCDDLLKGDLHVIFSSPGLRVFSIVSKLVKIPSQNSKGKWWKQRVEKLQNHSENSTAAADVTSD